MVFSSGIFLYFFLPTFLLLYLLSPRKVKSLTITLASYVFYGWWRPDFVLLMLFSTVVDFSLGAKVKRAQLAGATGKVWMLSSVVINLALLGYFKYANFGIDTMNSLLGGFGFEGVEWTKVILPVGISFYTFQTMSYTIDIYRRDSEAVKSFSDYMCYVSLFPQLVAGPIVRYSSVAEQLHSRTHSFGKFSQGVLCFQAGLIKKVLIADILAEVANQAFASTSLNPGDAWIGILAYALQIYFDFSGYSDMAIGLGLMLGFQFPINFNGPYRSLSITDFWRRWHISLSSFLRDYLYIPLGGNKKGPIRTHFNLAATMVLGGIWHGANWTFVAWGAYQGFWLICERLCGKRPFYSGLPKFLTILITFIIALFGWVFFRADGIQHALQYIGLMFGLGSGAPAILDLRLLHLIVFGVAAVVVWFFKPTHRLIESLSPSWALSLQPLFVLALIHLHYEANVPFLYYQF